MNHNNKQGAVALPLTLIVVLIIGLVILGSGISVLFGFVGDSIQVKETLDARTQMELETLLISQGQKVALPLHSSTVFRGESHVFGLGILNVLETTTDFRIEIELAQALDEQQQNMFDLVMAQSDPNKWLLYDTEIVTLEQNGNHKEAILVAVPKEASPGTYVYAVRVMKLGGEAGVEQYGNTQRIIVTVQ